MQPLMGTMNLSQSSPATFAALFMRPELVDELLARDTQVVAEVASGAMTQRSRVAEAIGFLRHVLACVYVIGSAIELGCKTTGDAGVRGEEVFQRATRHLG